jgi:hypothetical protein
MRTKTAGAVLMAAALTSEQTTGADAQVQFGIAF